ncbi:hypothetical protein A2U01_0084730, partial [Trifolium medium]|nr:hypothetical protein [Trifolium medium]
RLHPEETPPGRRGLLSLHPNPTRSDRHMHSRRGFGRRRCGIESLQSRA